MINEQVLVDQILAGKRINVYQMRYIVTLLSRHFLSQGLDKVQTRNKIFAWANSHGYYVKVYVKHIVEDSYCDLQPLNADVKVYINNSDIELIKSVSKTGLERKTALAFLCYAKIYADADGVVEMPISTVVDWIGQKNPQNVYNRIMPVLLERGFFTNEEDVHKWFGKIVKRTRTMRICHKLNNNGKHELINNDFQELYDSIKWK
jgi:hypothetical protein